MKGDGECRRALHLIHCKKAQPMLGALSRGTAVTSRLTGRLLSQAGHRKASRTSRSTRKHAPATMASPDMYSMGKTTLQ